MLTFIKNKSSVRDKIEVVLLIGFIIFLSIYYTNDYFEKRKIYFDKGHTTGKIIDYYVIFPESHYLKYQYLVDGKLYTKNVPASITFPKCADDKRCIGKEFVVEYEKANPGNSIIDLKQSK
jgi:hypothetical protein